jgi:DNA topoisomerase-1
MVFDGFLKLYQEGRDDEGDDENDRRLPPLKERDDLTRGETKPEQHFTEPPPRFTEASLVKRMEELGIGRPSTYASIIQVLQDRDYVKLDRKRFVPEDRGRLVTVFLRNFFERYVQYNFTADLENLLDEISGGRAEWKEVLRRFWEDFSIAVADTKDLTISQVLEALDRELGPHLFPDASNGQDPRLCPVCHAGKLSLKLGKFGAFVGCSNYPECRYTRPLASENGKDGEAGSAPAETGPRELGIDPGTGRAVSARMGPYGPYVQIEAAEGEKPKRVSLPKDVKAADIMLEMALALLSLPRDIDLHPETKEMITAGIGRFGPYIKHGKTFKSLSRDDDVLTIGINRAVSLLAEAGKGGRSAPQALRVLGPHPTDGEPVQVFKGRYGPYVSHGGLFGTLPKDVTPEDVTLEQGLALLQAQIDKGKKPKGARGANKASGAKTASNGKAAATKKATAKKAAAKKPAAKSAAKTKPASAKATG